MAAAAGHGVTYRIAPAQPPESLKLADSEGLYPKKSECKANSDLFYRDWV
jgi:hypothetical protein